MDLTIQSASRTSDQSLLIRSKLRAGHYEQWQINALDKLGHPIFGDGQLKIRWEEHDARLGMLKSLPGKLSQEFAYSCALRVLPIYQKQFPHDKRIRKCLETLRNFLDGKATEEELRATARAAADAVWAASWDARAAAWDARAAAWTAALDAARAAWSAEAAARAAAGVAAWSAEAAAGVAGVAAEAALVAAAQSKDEEIAWQLEELTRIVLGYTNDA